MQISSLEKNLPTIIGGTVRKKPKQVDSEFVDIPMEIIEKNRLITPNIDIMFVNKIAFLITHSQSISLIMTEHLPGRTAKHIAKHLSRVVNVYHHGGYKIQTMLMDNEFNKVADEFPQFIINTTTANEHMGEVE